MTTIYIQRLYISSMVFAFIEYSSYRLTIVFSRFNCLWCRQPAMIFQQSFTEEAKQSLVRNWPSSLLTLPSVRSGSQRLFFSFRVLSSSSLMPRYSSNTRAMHLLTRRFRLFSPSSSYDLLNRCNKIDNLIEFCVFFFLLLLGFLFFWQRIAYFIWYCPEYLLYYRDSVYWKWLIKFYFNLLMYK